MEAIVQNFEPFALNQKQKIQQCQFPHILNKNMVKFQMLPFPLQKNLANFKPEKSFENPPYPRT